MDAEGRGLTFNGKTWSTPHSDGSSDSSSFYAVSCPYSSYCVATGSRINPTGDYDYGEGIDLIYNNGSWGSLGAVTEDQPELGDQPESVSCASATFCVAANFGSVLTYNGETWSDADTIDTRPTLSGIGPLSQISCPTTSFCAMTESTGGVLTYTDAEPNAPENISPPTISGIAAEGVTLTAEHGSWSGAPTSYVYQWEACGSTGSCESIAGANSASYKLTASDAGRTMRVQEWAVNAGGGGGPGGGGRQRQP